MGKICKRLKEEEIGSIGIGAMIVFIAMVLVAGIAASVLVQTANRLEIQAMETGVETTDEVATGLAVRDIEGHVATDIDALAITVRARAGSPDIDLNETIILLTDGTAKTLLMYDFATSTSFNSSVDTTDGDVFGFDYGSLTNENFGIMVLEDADSSVKRFTPVINSGDKVMLFVDAIDCFGGTGILERVDVSGFIYPEHGSPGVISFRTPASYPDTIYDLQ
jgi:flagellin FlaB